MTQEKFYEIVNEWLEPKGFEVVFKSRTAINHEVHYIKDGTRIICTNNKHTTPECHVSRDLFTTDPITNVTSGTYHIPSDAAVKAHRFISNLKTIK